MTWKDVFLNRTAGKPSLTSSEKLARQSGYRFLAFEKVVYFLADDGSRHDTGISADQLDRTFCWPGPAA